MRQWEKERERERHRNRNRQTAERQREKERGTLERKKRTRPAEMHAGMHLDKHG